MHNQPDSTPTISPTAAVLLAIAVLSGTTLAGVVVAQAITPIHVYLGTGPLLGTIAGMCGCGFIVHTAAARVMRRLDKIEATMEEQREAGYAEGYVAATAGGRHLTAVSQR